MNLSNDEAALLERYLDALIKDPNAPVPDGLDLELASFSRALTMSQAQQEQAPVVQTRPVETGPAGRIIPLPARPWKRSGSYLTATAAGIAVIFFAALLVTLLNRTPRPNTGAPQVSAVQTSATRTLALSTLTPVPPVASPVAPITAPQHTCPPLTGKPGPQITVDSGSQQKLSAQLGTRLLDYLNTVGSADRLAAQLNTLTGDPNLKAQVFRLSLSYPLADDVLIFFPMATAADRFAGAMFAFPCQDSHYTLGATVDLDGFRLNTPAAPLATVVATNPQILSLRGLDASSDYPDIVYTAISKLDGTGNWEQTARIFKWLPTAPFDEVTPRAADETPLTTAFNGSSQIRDVDQNGVPDLVLTAGLPVSGAATQRRWEQSWGWSPNAPIGLVCKRALDLPTSRAQALADGDDNTACGYDDQALTLYQQAIFSSSLLDMGWHASALASSSAPVTATAIASVPSLRQRLEAYARYRIILLHFRDRAMDQARTDYDILQTHFPASVPGHEYAELARVFWEAAGGYIQGLGTGCQQVVSYAQAHLADIAGPLSYEFIGSAAELGSGSNLKDNLGLLCPYQ